MNEPCPPPVDQEEPTEKITLAVRDIPVNNTAKTKQKLGLWVAEVSVRSSATLMLKGLSKCKAGFTSTRICTNDWAPGRHSEGYRVKTRQGIVHWTRGYVRHSSGACVTKQLGLVSHNKRHWFQPDRTNARIKSENASTDRGVSPLSYKTH